MKSRIVLPLCRQVLVLSLLLGAALPVFTQAPAGDVRIHYFRPDGNYSGWGLYAWNAATATYSWCSSQVAQTGTDSFGVYFDVPVTPTAGTPAGQLGFILNNCANGQIKDPGPNQSLQVTEYSQGWVVSGNTTVFYNPPALGTNPVPAGDARIHYNRPDGNYTGWVSTPGTPPPQLMPGAQARSRSPELTASASITTSPLRRLRELLPGSLASSSTTATPARSKILDQTSICRSRNSPLPGFSRATAPSTPPNRLCRHRPAPRAFTISALMATTLVGAFTPGTPQ
jgi:hypothetical protein